jgi:hypothetical protein
LLVSVYSLEGRIGQTVGGGVGEVEESGGCRELRVGVFLFVCVLDSEEVVWVCLEHIGPESLVLLLELVTVQKVPEILDDPAEEGDAEAGLASGFQEHHEVDAGDQLDVAV